MNRQQIILECVVAHDFRWPRHLLSGVMFYRGERITIEDFILAVDKYKLVIQGGKR